MFLKVPVKSLIGNKFYPQKTFPLTENISTANFLYLKLLYLTETMVNKSQLVELIAKKTKFTKTDSEIILDATLEAIRKSVSKGNDVKLVGFGTFERAQRKSRTGRNPQTGKSLEIPAAKVPRFRPGKEFKDMVR